jgi:hypothetical protein
MRQKGAEESLYFQLGKMMGKRAVKKLKKSKASRSDL